MNVFAKWGKSFLWGMLYATLVVLLSQMCLRNLHLLVGFIDAGWDQDTAAQVAQAAGQLKNAALASPWLIALLAGGLIGLLMRAIFPKAKVRLWVSIAAGVLLLIPFTVLAIGFTVVNSIRVLELLQTVLPLFL